jgi:hypothetical protein
MIIVGGDKLKIDAIIIAKARMLNKNCRNNSLVV